MPLDTTVQDNTTLSLGARAAATVVTATSEFVLDHGLTTSFEVVGTARR